MVNISSNPLYYAAIGGIIIGIATSINYALRGSVTMIELMISSRSEQKIKLRFLQTILDML
jgi:uncharacterized membrane-anchored protein YitT (DUF2179 family)